jgi:hypothetical protein
MKPTSRLSGTNKNENNCLNMRVLPLCGTGYVTIKNKIIYK